MASTSNTRPSFFDDDDLNIKFEWEKLEKTPFRDTLKHKPYLADTLTRTQLNSSSLIQGHFLLYQRCIIQFKDSSSKQPEAVLEISNSRVKTLTGPQNGFSLTKNGNTYEFTSKNEDVIKNWFDSLKGICVQTTFHEDYKALKMIGKGSFAKVYLVESKATGKSYAVKAFTKESIILSNKNNAKPSMINEIDIMRCCDHENIIKLYEVFETEKSIYLVLELIQGKALQDVLKKSTFRETYNEIKVVNMMRSLLDALAYLAEKGIMHRDLKPDNILLDKGDKLKIADFGLATFIKIDTYIFKKCGTPGYIAPEVFKYDEKNPLTYYDDRCDVFSAGCIFFYMLFGYPFFDAPNASEILKVNRKFTAEFEAIATVKQELKNPSSKISKEGLSLLLELLEFDQRRRKRAADALKHPYFVPVPLDFSKVSENVSDSKGRDSPLSSGSKEIQSPISVGKQETSKYAKERYEQKDSLYIDVGQPVLNGRTDTITAGVGSNNNSLLIGQGPVSQGSNPSSLSKFAKGGRGGGGNDLMKAAIFKNMKMHAADSDSESPKNSQFRERSNSVGNKSGYDSSPSDSQSDGGSHFQKAADKQAKLNSSGKRYSLLDNRSAGNSPKVSGNTTNAGGVSRFSEETKSPK